MPRSGPRFLPLLTLLFFGSGCAALIYEIVWFQLLELVIGSTAVSLGVLLGTYMGGMCLGSLALPRVISARRNPLLVYTLLEIGIGVFAIAVLFGMPYVLRVYAAGVGYGLPGILLRALVCCACLLPPTMLMGATLPAVARWVETTPQGVSWLGFFYGGNIAGAVAGCLLAGFCLLRVYDMATATYVAVTINSAVALAAFALSGGVSDASPEQDQTAVARASWAVYITIALSGLCALGAEVIWTRLLSLMLGATVYTFSIILAVFLLGLGIGSSAGSILARFSCDPRIALGWCQLLLTAAVAWAALMIGLSLPYWPIDPTLAKSPWLNFQVDLARCLWTALPAACLWGASFPLALAALASHRQDPGRLVGGVYAANTAGAIAGAIGFSIVLIPWIGTQQSQRMLIGLSALAAVVALWARRQRALTVFACLLLGGLLAWSVSKPPFRAIAFGRRMLTTVYNSKPLYVGEGMNASVAVSQMSDGMRLFHVSGKVEASSDTSDLRVERMLGHLPALLHREPRSVLIVGCGAGITAGSFVPYPSVERITLCEIEPLIPKVVAQYFAKENYDFLRDRRTRVVYDDARHYVLTTNEKFDVITSDPIHPWVKGSATLYSKEYFEMCRRRLNPGGVIAQWVPLYDSEVNTVRSEIATFFEVFPNGSVWGNDIAGLGYDVVLVGQVGEARIDVDAMQSRLARPEYARVARSLRDVQFRSAIDLLATYAGQASDLKLWLRGAQINGDRNLRLQYMAAMGLNNSLGAAIYDELMQYRRFPDKLLVASPAVLKELKMALDLY